MAGLTTVQVFDDNVSKIIIIEDPTSLTIRATVSVSPDRRPAARHGNFSGKGWLA